MRNIQLGMMWCSALSLSLMLACQGELSSNGAGVSPAPAGPVVASAGSDSLGGGGGTNATGGQPGSAGVGAGGAPEATPATLLARLTNAEIVRSLAILLGIPAESPRLVQATASLPSEASVAGLANDASAQALTQLAIAGFERLAVAATEELLSEVTTNEQLAVQLGCDGAEGTGLTACLVSYGGRLLERASRRAPTSEHQETAQALLERVEGLQLAAGEDPTGFEARVTQLQSLVSYVVLSPDFLLLIEATRAAAAAPGEAIELDGYEIASRLSYFLTGEPPDSSLLAAAMANDLASAEGRIEQVGRLLERPETMGTFVQSLVGWLGVNQATADATDLEALSAYLNQWLEGGQPFHEFYDGAIEVATVDETLVPQNVGVLGARAYLAAHTDPATPSFITRGVFVVERLLCGALPDDVPDDAFEAGALTDLEVFEVHSKQPCASCHLLFDNYGAAFQSFEPETNAFDPDFLPFGTHFALAPNGDVSGEVTTLEELGQKIGASERAPACMAELFYRHALRRSLREPDRPIVARLVEEWMNSDMSLRSLLLSIVAAEEFALFFP